MYRRVTTHDTPIVISNAKKRGKNIWRWRKRRKEEERRGNGGKGEKAVGKRRKVLDEGRRGDNREGGSILHALGGNEIRQW